MIHKRTISLRVEFYAHKVMVECESGHIKMLQQHCTYLLNNDIGVHSYMESTFTFTKEVENVHQNALVVKHKKERLLPLMSCNSVTWMTVT